MSNWPFPKQQPNPEQVERLRRLARQEMEQGISREIAARVEAAESRAASLERECERLAAENAMLKARCRQMVNRLTPGDEIERQDFERVYSNHALTIAGAEIYPADLAAKRTEHGYEGPEDGFLNWVWRGWMWRATLWAKSEDRCARRSGEQA